MGNPSRSDRWSLPGSRRPESGPRPAVGGEPSITTETFRVVRLDDGEWVIFTAPEVTMRGRDRAALIARAQAALLRALAVRIERGDLQPPESFAVSIRRLG